MGLIAKLLRREERSSLSQPDGWFASMFGGKSYAGVTVSPEKAFGLQTVGACVRAIAETVATLPLHTYRRLADGKQLATEHPLYSILHDSPSPMMTKSIWLETAVSHVLLWGNSYSYIADGELVLLLPWRMTPEAKNGKIRYRYQLTEGGERILRPDEVLHVPGLGFDGLVGRSVISAHRHGIGLSLAIEACASGLFANGLMPSGIFTHPGRLSDPARKNWSEFLDKFVGMGRQRRFMLLHEGVKFEQLNINPDDGQFLQTAKLTDERICRMFRVPPSIVGITNNAPRANVEQENLGFVQHCIRPWLVRFEQEFQRKLFQGSQYFAEFNIDGLLRGDLKSRYESYAIGRQWGWLSANDIRRLENMNPIADGDRYMEPLNMETPAERPALPDNDRNEQIAQRLSLIAGNGHDREHRLILP